MVEQATHNRQVTGSNPVGATLSMACAVACQSTGEPVSNGVSSSTELLFQNILIWLGIEPANGVDSRVR
jgi:hypothetical protein